MPTPTLTLTLACSECGAEPGSPCLRQDGQPAARNHVRRTPEAPCGTFGGYQRHQKSKEPACAACQEARNAYMRAWRQETGDVANRIGMRAKSRALHRLKDRHPDEFEVLLLEELRAASP